MIAPPALTVAAVGVSASSAPALVLWVEAWPFLSPKDQVQQTVTEFMYCLDLLERDAAFEPEPTATSARVAQQNTKDVVLMSMTSTASTRDATGLQS